MSQCILVGVDADFSLPTHYAIEVVCQVLEQDQETCQLLLLHVIPVPFDPAPRWGRSLGSLSTYPATSSQQRQARHVLQQARTLLARRGVPLDTIELLVRAGRPADELVRVAQERHVDLLVLGSRPSSRLSPLRRALFGSTTRRVLQVASCRVLLARLPCSLDTGDLVAWYEQAMQLCLRQRTETLVVFTPAEVARRFALTDQAIGDREIEAAAQALERLANEGLMLCQVIGGEMRCWNE